jgi:hypothetical protein
MGIAEDWQLEKELKAGAQTKPVQLVNTESVCRGRESLKTHAMMFPSLIRPRTGFICR